MSLVQILLLIAGAVIVIPILAFMVMKFGAAGYFRAKQMHQKQKHKPTETDEI